MHKNLNYFRSSNIFRIKIEADFNVSTNYLNAFVFYWIDILIIDLLAWYTPNEMKHLALCTVEFFCLKNKPE